MIIIFLICWDHQILIRIISLGLNRLQLLLNSQLIDANQHLTQCCFDTFQQLLAQRQHYSKVLGTQLSFILRFLGHRLPLKFAEMQKKIFEWGVYFKYFSIINITWVPLFILLHCLDTISGALVLILLFSDRQTFIQNTKKLSYIKLMVPF